MSQFEFAQVLRARVSLISKGAPSTVDARGMTNPLDIAVKEIAEGRVPLRVTRTKLNGDSEVIDANVLDASEFISYTSKFIEKREKEDYAKLFY